MKFISLFMIVFSILSIEASAREDTGVFGPEWTFTSPRLINMYRVGGSALGDSVLIPYAETLINSWVDVIKRRCPSCTTNWVLGDMRVQVDENFWFSINLDQLVLEVNSTPATIKTFRKYRDQLQSLVWDSALEIGLEPHYRFGGGHVHISKEESFKSGLFVKKPNDFYKRNFLADMLSNSEVFMGGLGFDLLNASGLSLYSLNTHRRLEIALEEFDDFVIDYDELERRIVEDVYKEHAMIVMPSMARGNQFLSFSDKNTYEVRGLRPQVSMDHFLFVLELLQARINKSKTNQAKRLRPTPLINSFRTSTDRRMQRYIIDIHPKRLESTVVDYIERSGLDSELFRPYFTEELKGSLRAGSNVLDSSFADYTYEVSTVQCKKML